MRKIGWLVVAGAVVAASGLHTGGPPAVAAERASVAVVGDSIGRDAAPEVRAAVEATNPISYYHAIAAGYVDYHLPLLLDPEHGRVREPDGPDIVVAELGAGDAFWSHGARRFEADMRQFLNQVTPHVQCVIWIDQKETLNRAFPDINARAAAFNDVVHRVVADYPEATYLHYEAWTRLAGAPSPYFLADYLHLTAAGQRELARLIAGAVRGCDADLRSGPFWDVPDAFWAADAINWAAAAGIVRGYDNHSYRASIGRFRPAVTRGAALDMVWRLVGAPPEPTPHGFPDGRPALRAALRWGRASGVATPFPDGTFRPGARLQRGAALMMLWRAAGRPVSFPDHPWFAAAPHRLLPALRWAVANGVLVPGVVPFDATQRVNRAEIARWLQSTDAFLDRPVLPSAAPSAPPTTVVPSPTTAPPEPPPTVPEATTVP